MTKFKLPFSATLYVTLLYDSMIKPFSSSLGHSTLFLEYLYLYKD